MTGPDLMPRRPPLVCGPHRTLEFVAGALRGIPRSGCPSWPQRKLARARSYPAHRGRSRKKRSAETGRQVSSAGHRRCPKIRRSCWAGGSRFGRKRATSACSRAAKTTPCRHTSSTGDRGGPAMFVERTMAPEIVRSADQSVQWCHSGVLGGR
jgi:hypothetical protein